jgi:hypothetical protein
LKHWGQDMAAIGKLGTIVGAIACIFALNLVLYMVTGWIGRPTVIAGLGWSLDVFPLNSLMIMGATAAIGMHLSNTYDPEAARLQTAAAAEAHDAPAQAPTPVRKQTVRANSAGFGKARNS